MKANGEKRKIFDAVDLLTEDGAAVAASAPGQRNDGVAMLRIDSIQPFHDHPFHLYEGERLQDMVESVTEHGVLNPVIVRKQGDDYEMLAGHNRMNAARLAGMTEIPAIVKDELADEEAYVYVIETNVIQRSFAELLPTEKAAVMEAHYNKVCCQGRRNDIIRELQVLSGVKPSPTSDHNGQKLNSREVVAAEYGFSSSGAARYLRINYLIRPFKDLIDENKLGLVAAVDLSYLSEDEQKMVWDVADEQRIKLKPPVTDKLHKASGSLTRELIEEIVTGSAAKKKETDGVIRLKLPKVLCDQYFAGMDAEQMTVVVTMALAAWFQKEKSA
ncbi:MAG: ParB/RepB/Spo0J family partition protein [Clostridiales bacterium]|nr:ParB/RepB/Spo0J family partition protein [Clostridiales bacterium]